VAISQARTAGDRGDEVAALDNLSHALIDAGEVEEAWAVALQALRQMIDGQVGLYGLGTIVAAVARCASLRGEPERALLLGAALRASVLALAQHVAASRRAALEAAEGASREALDEETAARAVATGEAMTLEALLEYLGELE
jgi:hypothetical protein